MMSTELRPGLHSALSYTLLVTLLVVLTNAFVIPAITKRGVYREQIGILQEQNGRFLASIDNYETLISTASLAPVEDIAIDSEQFLKASTVALAGANLQSTLRTYITQAEGSITSSSILQADTENAFTKVVINLRFKISINNLTTLLLSIEQNPQMLFIDNLVIQSRHQEGRVLNALSDELEVRMNVAGFMANPEGAEGQ